MDWNFGPSRSPELNPEGHLVLYKCVAFQNVIKFLRGKSSLFFQNGQQAFGRAEGCGAGPVPSIWPQ